jgi:hypothetical protein
MESYGVKIHYSRYRVIVSQRERMSYLFGSHYDVSCDITPLLTSFLPSEGPDICGAVGVGHSWVVIRGLAHSSGSAPLVQNAAMFFHMPHSVTEQALIDAWAVARGVPIPLAPLAAFVVLVGAMLPPVHEVVKACIEHGPQDVRGRQGIMEDVWL